MNNPYGRLATPKILKAMMKDAKDNGGRGKINKQAGTVKMMLGDDILFSALQKDANTWLIMYNPEFYPKPS